MAKKPIKVTEVVLRDAHQSLLATRMTMDEMRPILPEMDKINYFSVECWGGATFDSCIRFLDEDPWERLRILRKELPHQKLQMLFRGQNMLGYRPYADDAVEYFVQKSVANGIDVIRIFDALNDPRNLQTAIKSANKEGAHVQGCISYTLSPVHNNEYFAAYAKTLEEMGANSICIKDMAGLLTPYTCYDLVKKLKETVSIPVDIHSHYTAGLASMSILKGIEAGADIIDTAMSPLSLGTSHMPTESLVAALQGSDQTLGGHVAGAQAQGAHGGIDDVGTCLDALQDGHGSQTCGVVAVDVNRDADGLLQLLDQIIAGIGSEQTCHILDADGVCAHFLQSLGVGCKVLVVMHGAQGIADAALHMSAFLVGRLDGSLQVAGVVQSVKDADDVDAVGNRLLYKVLHSVICVGTVAQHILAAEQHLQLLVRQFLAQDAQTLPRILVQEADAAVERSAAPALHGEVVDLVHFGQDGAHLVHGHTGSQQRLVRITQDDLGHLDRLFCHGCHLFLSSWKPERHRS